MATHRSLATLCGLLAMSSRCRPECCGCNIQWLASWCLQAGIRAWEITGLWQLSAEHVFDARQPVGQDRPQARQHGKHSTKLMCVVVQFDIHSPQTTVAEAVYFSARLRLPRDVPNDQARQFQHQVCSLKLNMQAGSACPVQAQDHI